MGGMHHDFDRLAALSQDELWDDEAADSYDTPGQGMDAPDVVGPTADRLAALADGGHALEFALGTGRIAIPLIERGVRVAGIEYSGAMIRRLREKASADRLPVTQGDMSTTRVDGDFALVYLVFNTIGNLLTQDAQVECFRNAAAHLRPGGCFVIELWVPDLRRMPPGVPAAVEHFEDGYILVDTMDTLRQHLISYHFRFGDGRDATVGRTPHRYIWPSELDLMGRLAGFELESRWSDWHGSPFTQESTSHVSVYRLPG
jgi:SAM-dependent methyltransferase